MRRSIHITVFLLLIKRALKKKINKTFLSVFFIFVLILQNQMKVTKVLYL